MLFTKGSNSLEGCCFKGVHETISDNLYLKRLSPKDRMLGNSNSSTTSRDSNLSSRTLRSLFSHIHSISHYSIIHIAHSFPSVLQFWHLGCHIAISCRPYLRFTRFLRSRDRSNEPYPSIHSFNLFVCYFSWARCSLDVRRSAIQEFWRLRVSRTRVEDSEQLCFERKAVFPWSFFRPNNYNKYNFSLCMHAS
jgi:hypothetical protein